MYQQYQGQFFQHVSIIGEQQYAIEFKSRYDDCDQNPKENIQLNFVQKIEESSDQGITFNQIRVGGDQGLLKQDWVSKISGKKPSVIVYLLEMVPAQMQALFAKFQETKRILSSKTSNNQQKMMTKLIVILFSKAGVGPDVDVANAQIKQALEIDSKNIFNLPQTQDAVYLNIRKIKKLIVEYANNYYDEKYKKYKKNISKHNDLIANEKNLTLHFKMAIIDEQNLRIDKAKKHYQSAYSECESLMTSYRMHANKTIIPNNQESIDSNYDMILKLEELRFIADAIKVRQLIILIQEKQHQEAIQLFIIHYKKFKESVDYFDTIFQFEEYKWRTELFKVFITEMQKESLNKSSFIDQNLFNLIIGCVVYGQERFLLFQGFKNIEQNQSAEFQIIKKPPIYFGRQNYIVQASQRVSYNEQKIQITRMVKNERLFQENKEIEMNMLSENLAFLNMCEELFPQISERQKLIILYRRLYNCALSRDFEQFVMIVEEILPKLSNYKMNEIKTYILETYEGFLKGNNQPEKLLNISFQLLIQKEETIQEKQERAVGILKQLEKLGKNDDLKIQIEKENFAFKIEIEFLQNRIKAFEKSSAIFKFTNFTPALNIYKKVEINLNDTTQKIEFEMNIEKNKNSFEKQIEFVANNLKVKNISIESIVLSSETTSTSGKKLSLNVCVPATTLKYKNYSQLLIEKPHEPSVEISFKKKDQIFLNDLFNLQICSSYLDGTTDYLVLKNPQLFFYECIVIKDKNQTITVDHSDNQVFQLNGQQKLPLKSQQLIPLNFEIGDQLITKLMLRVNKMQEDTTFLALVKYSIFNKKTNVEEPRQTQKILDIKVKPPFTLNTKWGVSNSQQQNQETKKKNQISEKNDRVFLPSHYLCNFQIKLTSQMENVIIYSVKVNMNKEINQIKLIRDINIQKQRLALHESLSLTQYIQTLSHSPQFKYGSIQIQFATQDDLQDSDQLNTYQVDLGNVIVESKAIKVEVEYPEVAKLGELFEMVIKVTNMYIKPQDLKIILNERESKKFLLSGKIISREYVESQQTIRMCYKLIPVEIGRFRLPGFQIEQKYEETYSIIYDSHSQKHIVILPQLS
ncbi:hypothetical protein ABPG72_004710 [Tetrahymena utriculariae]